MSLELDSLLKESVTNVINATKPTDAIVGTVVETGPVRIQLDNFQGPLPAKAIDIPDSFDKYTVQVTGATDGELVIDNSLKVGDKVHLIKKQGAQKYLVIGRVI